MNPIGKKIEGKLWVKRGEQDEEMLVTGLSVNGPPREDFELQGTLELTVVSWALCSDYDGYLYRARESDGRLHQVDDDALMPFFLKELMTSTPDVGECVVHM